MRTHFLFRLICGLTAPLMVMAILATDAHAAPYAAWSCASPEGSPLPSSDWRPTRTAPIATLGSSCGSTGGALEATAYAAESNPWITAGGGWEATAPKGTAITSADVWWTNTVNPVSAPPFGRIQVYAKGPGNDGSAYARDDSSFGLAGAPFSEASHQAFRDLAAPSIGLIAWCAAHCTQSYQRVTASYAMYRARLLVSDPEAPTGSAAGITDGARISTATPIAVFVDDVGGGVAAVELRVGGQTVDRIAAGGRCTDLAPGNDLPDYDSLQPCPPHLQGILTLRPEALGSSAHLVTVHAIDAAGNTTGILGARVALVQPRGFYDQARGFFNPDLNPTAPRAVNGANGGPAKSMRLRVTPTTVRFHRRALVRGTLTAVTGAPIAGARVWVATAARKGGWRLARTPLITSSRGNVRAWLPARRPSRSIRLVYFPYTDLSGHGVTNLVRLNVRAGARLTANRTSVVAGGRVRLTARLRIGVPKDRSVLGTLQVRVNGRWRSFRQLRFRRQSRTLRAFVPLRQAGSTYPMRLRIPKQTGLRYTTGVSNIVTVTVR